MTPPPIGGDYKPGCTGKMRYANPMAAMGIKLRKSQRQKPLHPYQCLFCNGWHLTSQPRDVVKRKSKDLRR